MRKSILLISCFLLLSNTLILAQTSEFLFEKSDAKPGFIALSKQYTDSSLWGYMNGGADLFLEYGLKKLTHQEIVFRNLLYKADIYEMNDSAAAFGIYSISVFKCGMRSTLTSYDCLNPYQTQFAVGNYYVSISNVRGDSNAITGSSDLAKKLLKKASFRPFVPPSIFQSTLLAEYQPYLKVIYGPLGLQNGYPDWADRFESMKNYYITMLPHKDSTGSILMARIFFDKADDLQKFRELSSLKTFVNQNYWRQSEGDKTKALIQLDEKSCLYLETESKHKIFQDLILAFDKVGGKAGGSH